MRKFGRKALSAILTFALLAGLLPTAALAAGDTYTYLDDKGQPQTCTTATVVESSNKEHIEVDWSDTEGNNGWYVVTGSVSISGRIVVTGEVHLILADSCTLNAQQGINVSTGNSLTIYGQSKGTGALTANVPAGELVAAIGGGYDPLNSYDGEDCGTVTINGGHVTATGAENGYGAGIGGGGGGDVGGAGGTFSTGTGGSAVIFAQGGENAAAISDTSGQENWQGVIFQGNAGQVYGGVTLSDDVEIPAGYTLTIPSGTSLTVPEGKTLTNNGTITGDGSLTGEGTLINNGTVFVLNNDFMATVEVSISPSPATYNSSVSLTAMVTDGSEQINSGTVKFYQGEINAANELNSDSVNVTSGTATYTIATVDWMPGSYTITAVYTPVEDSDLLESSGTAQLTVNKAEQKAPSAPTLSGKTSTSIMLNEITTTGQGNVQYACVEGKNRTAPTGDESWQTSTTFDRLKPGTDYTCFARYAGNDCYEPSPASSPGLTDR